MSGRKIFTNGWTANVILGSMFVFNVVKTVLMGAAGFNTRERNLGKNNLGVGDKDGGNMGQFIMSEVV